MSNYNFTLILIITLGSYFISWLLFKKNKITLLQHRRFWNTILLFSFLVTCFIGLFLAFSIDNQLSLGWYLPLIWYHVEFGIVMALVSIFHLIWHIPYYKSYLSKSKTSPNTK
jgi:cytochrome b561